jgi:hypothetical protein
VIQMIHERDDNRVTIKTERLDRLFKTLAMLRICIAWAALQPFRQDRFSFFTQRARKAKGTSVGGYAEIIGTRSDGG